MYMWYNKCINRSINRKLEVHYIMTKGKKGGRVFEVVTRIKDDNGNIIISRDKVEEVLHKYKSIERYAYVCHNKDYLTKEEIREMYQSQGQQVSEEQIHAEWIGKKYKRPDHIHVVFETPNNYFKVENIAKWFGLAPNFVRVKSGQGAFLDAVQYLTHEDQKQQDLGKFRYSDKEIISNFEWRGELTKKLEEKAKYGKSLTARERLQLDVLFNGLTLKQARELDPYNYNKDLTILKRNRGDYLANQKPPVFKANFYVYGKGGVGKDIMARSMAKSLFPDIEDPDEVYFVVGSDGVEFEGYDGQPILIWSDVRANTLLARWGRDNLLSNILEPFTEVSKKANIKYGSTTLVNSINIFTGADDYITFLNGLVGEYVDSSGKKYQSENRAQSYRRFPMIIPVSKESFEVMLNKGFMEDNDDWESYYTHKNVRGSFRKLHNKLDKESDEFKEVENRLLLPIKTSVDLVNDITIQKNITAHNEEIDDFKYYGMSVEEAEEQKKIDKFNEEQMEFFREDDPNDPLPF